MFVHYLRPHTSKREPVCIIVHTDPRLGQAQCRVDVLTMSVDPRSKEAVLFQGTVVAAVRTGAQSLIMHDVAVSRGYSFVGNWERAGFLRRQSVLTRLRATFQTMFTPHGWQLQTAPFIRCGTKRPIPALNGVESRGVWVVRNSSSIDAPRLLWRCFDSVKMSLFGVEWFVSAKPGEQGNISKLIPNITPQASKDDFGPLESLTPGSVGSFVAMSSHHTNAPCKKWLVMHRVEEARALRAVDLQPWEHVRLNCSTKEEVESLFLREREQTTWDNILGFVMHGTVKHPDGEFGVCKRCGLECHTQPTAVALPSEPSKRARSGNAASKKGKSKRKRS